MDPAWWFTGVFFALLIKLAPKLWEVSVSSFKRILRNKYARYKRTIKNNRHNIAAVNYQSAKSQAFFVMFLIAVALYIVWYVAGPLREIQKTNLVVFVICIMPMYIVQFFWIFQANLAKEMIKEYHKLRVARRSKRPD